MVCLPSVATWCLDTTPVSTFILSLNTDPSERFITTEVFMEPATGIEPATYWLQISCAANCATPAFKEFGEQFQSHASSMELHNLEYAQRVLHTPKISCSSRATELVLRVFHWWGRYCLHLTFSACLRTHGPRYRIRTGPICLEGRDASRWHQSRINVLRFLSQPCINIISRFLRKIKF